MRQRIINALPHYFIFCTLKQGLSWVCKDRKEEGTNHKQCTAALKETPQIRDWQKFNLFVNGISLALDK